MDQEVQEVENPSGADSVRAAIAELAAETEVEAEDVSAEAVEAEEVQEAVESEEPVEPVSESDQEVTEEPSEEEPEEVILPPAAWNKEDREEFAKADRKIQEIVARREAEREKGANKIAREAAPLKAVAEEFQDYFRQVGVTPDQSFRYLVAAEQSLRFGTPQQKTEALQQIARNYGISLDAKAPERQEDEIADPALAHIESVIDERLGRIEGQLTSRQQAEEDARKNEANDTAATFFEQLEAADPADMPSARYVEQVMPQFQAIVKAEPATGKMPSLERLRELWDSAAWATPGVRQAMLDDMAARDKAKAQAAKRTVKKVSSGASGGSGSPAHSDEPPKDESARDTVRRVIRQASG